MSAQNDSAFLKMFLMILGALVVFTVIILVVANTITGAVEEAREPDPRERSAIAERIKPVGRVNVVGAPAAVEASADASAVAQSGADIAAMVCNACHTAGVLGAPKIGDKAAWSQRLATAGDVATLTASVISGKGGMPPRGGSTVDDAGLRAAVEHLLAQSDVDVPAAAAEAVPAPEAAAPEAAAPEAAAAPAGYDLAKGKSIYDSACFACHLTGAAGAPKLGDQALWAPRIEQGMDALIASVINGKGNMPPKGGRMDIADADIASAVAYMVKQAQ